MKTQNLPMIALLSTTLPFALPIPTRAEIRYAATCSRPDVGNAVTASTHADTVVVPEGTCTWSSALTITRAITLRGAGATKTTIRSGGVGGHLLVYRPDALSVTTQAKFELVGFTFDMGNNGDGGIMVDSTNSPIRNVVIHDNTFRNQTSTKYSVSAVWIGEHSDVYGVLYSNTFENVQNVSRNYGAYAKSWNETIFTFGSENNFYWEDNTLLTGNTKFHSGGHGGRYVMRFNNYAFAGSTYEVVWDVHGNQPGGIYGTMGCEIYNNSVTLEHQTAVFDQRGGSCMFFQNTITGSKARVSEWKVREEYDDSISPEDNPQPQHVSDSYYFLNTSEGASRAVIETQDCCNAIAENQQFWNYTDKFDGRVGVGAGPISARPASCTAGVAYWATDEGEWNSRQPGPDGQLYKCTATNTWTLCYRPYPYPHPLRIGSPPAAPTNLRVVPLQ